MANILGIILFALGIGVTIALHEAGHMTTARYFGMCVRRFSIGFGPKLLGFRRGQTEYSLALLPVGGFCDIAGMTAQDEDLTAEEAPHAMYKKPAWQRVVVMSGGVIVNVILGFAIIFGVAVTAGIPDLDADMRPRVGEVVCVADQTGPATFAECTGTGPAGAAGVQSGDILLALDGHEITDFGQLRAAVLSQPGAQVILRVERGGQQLDLPITLAAVERWDAQGNPVRAGSLGITNQSLDVVKTYEPVAAVGATARYSAHLAESTVAGIVKIPAAVPGVIMSIFGGQRQDDSPMSVVGASRVGGELVQRNLWPAFFMMLASLNYFLALFNLIPLPPFDGGHIAIIGYEKLRDWFRRSRGLAPKGPANYQRIMPVTYVVAGLLMAFGVLVIVADVVNPIRLFG